MGQDLPPSGGYEPIQYKVRPSHRNYPKYLHNPERLTSNLQIKQRNIPARGFRPTYYFAAIAAVMTYGMYQYGKGARELK